jgi:hypothetical protein
MPRVRLILEDDHGRATEQSYPLEGQCDTLNQIEAAVETFKNQALPHLEQTLLDQAQQRFATQEKKKRPAS